MNMNINMNVNMNMMKNMKLLFNCFEICVLYCIHIYLVFVQNGSTV